MGRPELSEDRVIFDSVMVEILFCVVELRAWLSLFCSAVCSAVLSI